MDYKEKILAKQDLTDEEIRQLVQDKKENLLLLYLRYCPLIYAQELWLVNSGMKKALRKQIKL